jgi:hypothetical protein
MDITLLCIAATAYDGEDEPLTSLREQAIYNRELAC